MYHTEMIRNKGLRLSFSVSFVAALLFHMVALFFIKKNSNDYTINGDYFRGARPLKIDQIKFISPEEVEHMKRVGVKDGAKNKFFQPDQLLHVLYHLV